MKRVAAVFTVALVGCATLGPEHDESRFSGEFDPAWMAVQTVDHTALPIICAGAMASPFHRELNGCAKLYVDAGGKVGTCRIYISRMWQPGSEGYKMTLTHEAKHCRGWRHVGDTAGTRTELAPLR